ncbi:MAG: fumarate hydratase C-terminal domain-containing protein [Gammaproteobacteria bacterium]|nr:fumarate hydratase C-terminal domain-containing protein [Gammaproteobacteria bacterium]
MPDTHYLTTPVDRERIAGLALGDSVYLSGDVVITAGIPSHQRLMEMLESDTPIPVPMAEGALLHFGASHTQLDGKPDVAYINPTTSSRFNPFMPTIISRLGLRVVGGKGGLNAACAQAMRRTGCVYLSFPGGAAPLYARALTAVRAVYWDDFIEHYRLTLLQVDALGPATVAIDAEGRSLYDDIAHSAAARLETIINELDRTRENDTAQCRGAAGNGSIT